MPMTLEEFDALAAAMDGHRLLRQLEEQTLQAADSAATLASSVEMEAGMKAMEVVLDEKAMASVRERVEASKARVGLATSEVVSLPLRERQ